MSERAKGWTAWMAKGGAEGLLLAATAHSVQTGCYTDPVHIIPLDPDGPLPGEVWEHDGSKVEVLGPHPAADEGIWWVGETGSPRSYWVARSQLSRPPTTKTVTVELTEDEQMVVRQFGQGTSHPTDSTIRKLAAALEDE